MTTQDQGSLDQKSGSRLRLSRRHAIQGAAWSVPVITVATAAPAFASSPLSDWDVNQIEGFRAATNTTTQTTTTDGRMFYAKCRPIITTGPATSIPVTVTVTFPDAGGGVGWEPTRSTMPSGWALASVTGPGAIDLTPTNAVAVNGLVWTFAGPATTATTQLVACFGKNATNTGALGAVTGPDAPAGGISLVVKTTSTDIPASRRTATVVNTGAGTNAILSGPATFSA